MNTRNYLPSGYNLVKRENIFLSLEKKRSEREENGESMVNQRWNGNLEELKCRNEGPVMVGGFYGPNRRGDEY